MSGKFCVYIIESPSADDHYYKRAEANPLNEALRLIGVQSLSRTVIGRSHLQAAISECAEAVKSGSSPIALHISAHGAEHGIGLTSGEVIEWEELGKLFKPLTEATRGDLLVCMSSCDGFHGIQMAMTLEAEPFSVIVGPVGKPTYADTTVAYLTLYHLMAKGCGLPEAVEKMNGASGHTFGFRIGAELKNQFLEIFHTRLLNSVPEQPSVTQ